MKLIKVGAESYPECLRKMQIALSSDATVVGTRSFRRGGVPGDVGGFEAVECYVHVPTTPSLSKRLAAWLARPTSVEHPPAEASRLVLVEVGRGVALELLKRDASFLSELTDSMLEDLVVERLERQGFKASKTRHTYAKDGGIDIIAVPKKRSAGAFVVGCQVKSHRGGQKTGSDAVHRLLGWRRPPFHLGLLVTNTRFTKHARFAAESDEAARHFLRLRDEEDLRRWIQDDFSQEGREIPKSVELAKGVTIEIPEPTGFSVGLWVANEKEDRDGGHGAEAGR